MYGGKGQELTFLMRVSLNMKENDKLSERCDRLFSEKIITGLV